jgi:hypothetical protein
LLLCFNQALLLFELRSVVSTTIPQSSAPLPPSVERQWRGKAAEVIGVAVVSMTVNILYSTAVWLTKQKVHLLPLLSKAA